MGNGSKAFGIKQRTEDFAVAIVALVRRLPGGRDGRILGDQMMRSGMSIGANVEEAHADCEKDTREDRVAVMIRAVKPYLIIHTLSFIIYV